MIARIIVPLILLIIFPDVWEEWRNRGKRARWKRILAGIFDLFMIIVGLKLAFTRDFVPDEMSVLNAYMFVIGVVVVPRVLYCLCSAIGYAVRKRRHSKKNWGNLVGLILVVLCWFILIIGSTYGQKQLEIENLEYCSTQLPDEFDGYRILHISDFHLGSYRGNEAELQRLIDSIQAQPCDIMCFTGDVQNVKPQELYQFIDMMRQIKAKDGVIAILGNHDYSKYQGGDEIEKAANERETQNLIRQFGWKLLMNENIVIRRGADSIYIAGMENWQPDGEPIRGDIAKTMAGIDTTAFTVMLTHEPVAWRKEVLPKSHAQLTLAGHTHGGQLRFFGHSPAELFTSEWAGRYDEGPRTILVSIGLGGVIPFRFDCPRTLYNITLRKK